MEVKLSTKLSDVITRAKQYGLIRKIKRYSYMPYKMEIAIQCVEEIGKAKSQHFVIDDNNRFVFENLIRWIQGDPEMQCLDPNTKQVVQGCLEKGIYIAGSTGTGKSWALDVMSVYSMIDEIRVGIPANEHNFEQTVAIAWQSMRADAICSIYANKGDISDFKTRTVLCIQDIGAEPIESVYMGNRSDVIRQILEYRGDYQDKITLITSNLPMGHEMLEQRYGDRVASRLFEMCNYFEIKGKDRRK